MEQRSTPRVFQLDSTIEILQNCPQAFRPFFSTKANMWPIQKTDKSRAALTGDGARALPTGLPLGCCILSRGFSEEPYRSSKTNLKRLSYPCSSFYTKFREGERLHSKSRSSPRPPCVDSEVNLSLFLSLPSPSPKRWDKYRTRSSVVLLSRSQAPPQGRTLSCTPRGVGELVERR